MTKICYLANYDVLMFYSIFCKPTDWIEMEIGTQFP